jgi:hypothetical protein
VHPSAQFRFDGFQLGCHTFADGLPHHRELARLVYGSAGVRETQKVKGFRLPFPIPLSIFDGKSPELYQARLFRMQFQPELSQPFPQLLQESLRYFPVLEPDDEVVRVADHNHVPNRVSLAPPNHPLVEYVMQVDVRYKRGADGLNAKDNFDFEREVRYRQEGKKNETTFDL